ncbi:MAG: carbon starvation protein A, partial [Thermodesulfobacteriota bacterium]
MKLSNIVILILSLVAAVAIAVSARIFNPSEEVNALWLVVAAACFFIVTYRVYGAFLTAKVFALSKDAPTPASRLSDGTDYHPTNRWVLFGHQFAAIAGAGPLIGPVLAAQFGYLPGFLWILIGAAVAGSVHDMVVLVASVRHDGCSLAQIARKEVGPIAGITIAFSVLFIVIVALAGLGLVVVNALYKSPWGTFTIIATVPIALLMGVYMQWLRPGRIAEITVIGVILMLAAVVGGGYVPGSSIEQYFSLERSTLIWALAIYGFLASVLPIWLLLAPRDYISTYMKIGTILLLAAGVILMAPTIKMPAITGFVDGGGPIIPGTVFPFMFITIACGAVSGFHALISSGTTPKMMQRETDARMIGFGAMLCEGFVAVIALIAATVLIPGDYFAINTRLSFDAIAAIGFPVERINELSAMVGVEVAGRPGGAVSLAVGMAYIFSNLPGMKGLMPYWYNFALMFEALFILTTIDSGTRVARFVVQELAGKVYRPAARINWLPGVVVSTLIVVLCWAYLITSGSVSNIWPMFGVANQLLAALALCVGTSFIIKSGKAKYAWVTAVPMVFMFFTTYVAAWELFWIFLGKAAVVASPFSFRLNAVLVVVMAVLATVALVDS